MPNRNNAVVESALCRLSARCALKEAFDRIGGQPEGSLLWRQQVQGFEVEEIHEHVLATEARPVGRNAIRTRMTRERQGLERALRAFGFDPQLDL